MLHLIYSMDLHICISDNNNIKETHSYTYDYREMVDFGKFGKIIKFNG